MSPITSHVLDTALGRPAAKVGVRLDVLLDDGSWETLEKRFTDEEGRVTDLLPAKGLEFRTYRLSFDTGAYFAASGRPVFYPWVDVVFSVQNRDAHYHVPLLLSPFGYSTYRGS